MTDTQVCFWKIKLLYIILMLFIAYLDLEAVFIFYFDLQRDMKNIHRKLRIKYEQVSLFISH